MTETHSNEVQRRCAALLLLWSGIVFLSGCSGASHSQNPNPEVLHAPVIFKQPVDQTAHIGEAASIAVTATGTAPLIYDWRRNGVSLSGANAATYTTPPLTGADDGATYTVVVSNTAGSVLSSAAKLSINPRPAQITAAPPDISVLKGKNATSSVTINGTAPIAYRWLLNENALTGAKALGYTLAAAKLTDSGRTFAVMASNPAIGTFVGPTISASKEVTVTPFKLHPTDDNLKLTGQTLVTAAFGTRLYRALMPEVGVGAVRGYISRPLYDTGPDAYGRTVVTLSSTDYVSIDPSIMVNFICHCNAGGVAPMLQMGATASKDLPALLLGGGFRLFGLGKGDIGIGGGLLLGWYKDLQKLKVGSAVGGTADIGADMGYVSTPKTAPYISLQYKF